MVQPLSGETYARSFFDKPVEFYTGLSGGGSWVKGRRTDSVFDPNLAPPVTLYFSNNRGFSESNAQYSAFGGVSVSFPQTGIVLGPEIHLGRSHGNHEVREWLFEPLTGTSRTLVSALSPSAYLGAVLRVGYEFGAGYVAYLAFGGEVGRYKNRVTYVPQSAAGLGGVDTRSGFFQSQKWLRGALWGIGLEKKLHSYRFGTDLRFADYNSFKTDFPYTPSNETVLNTFKFKNVRFSLRISYLF